MVINYKIWMVRLCPIYSLTLTPVLCCHDLPKQRNAAFLNMVSIQFSPAAESDTVTVDSIPEEWMGLDVGPKTISAFEDALAPCKTIVSDCLG